LRYRRWGFFGAFAPQNDSFLYIFQITHINARSAESTLEQCVYERHEKAMLNGQGCRLGKQTTRAAALVFFLVPFSKVKKEPSEGRRPSKLSPGAGRNPASPRPRRVQK
jgi:hypothetical protein